jgi:hypothetical protein
MRTVIVYYADNEGHPIEVGRAVLQPTGDATLEGFARHRGLRAQLEHGLFAWPPQTPRVMLTDGQRFLDALPFELHGSRVWAEER